MSSPTDLVLYNPAAYNLERPLIFPFGLSLDHHLASWKSVGALTTKPLLYSTDIIAILVQPIMRSFNAFVLNHRRCGGIVHSVFGKKRGYRRDFQGQLIG